MMGDVSQNVADSGVMGDDTSYQDGLDEIGNAETSSIPVGTKIDLTLSVNADQLPTAVDLALTVPGNINLSVGFTAAYANKAVTTLACTADVTLFANQIDEAYVYEYDDDDDIIGEKRAEILADTTVHAELTFDPAKLALQATGKPLYVTLTASFANIQYKFDGEAVASFDGLKFTDKDAKMEDPQNASFTLDSNNNGQGLIRFTAIAVTGENTENIGALDVRVGSAPNFVTPEESPYAELSDVVAQLLAMDDVYGEYAYTIGANTYYFRVYGEGHQNDQGKWEYENAAELEICQPATEEAPWDRYTVITVNEQGKLVLTPVEPVFEPDDDID